MADVKAKQIYLWYGENDFEIHEKVMIWTRQFEKKHGRLNFFNFDLREAGAREKIAIDLKNALQVNSLFGMNKLIVLKNFLGASAKLEDEAKKMIVAAIEKNNSGFFLLFCQADKPDERGIIFKALKALSVKDEAEIKRFEAPRPYELKKWVEARAKKLDAFFAPGATDALAAAVGNDLWQIDREMNKLAHYRKGEPIKVEDVKLMVRGKYNDVIFDLTDAISARDKKRTLKLFQDQVDSGAEDMYLLTMLIRQFRIFWQILEAKQAGALDEAALAAELGLHPYVVKKGLQYANNFTLPQVKKIYRKLLDCEVGIKMRNISFELMFDLLVAEL